MGIDVEIYFECDGEPVLERWLPSDYKIVPVGDRSWEGCDGATHRIETMARYYGEGYERGPWGEIASVLMLLHACPSVKRVWYGGDDHSVALPECPPERVLELCAHFMRHGERPYRDARNLYAGER